jgi:NTE family protein
MPARVRRPSRTTPGPIGLALAGGGPLGAVYEIGALCALQESLTGIDFNRLGHYVGVSSGAFIAAGLANGMTPKAMCQAFIRSEERAHAPRARQGQDLFDPASLMVPAWDEYARCMLRLPGLLLSAGWNLMLRRQTLLQALEHMAPAVPAGLLSNHQVDRQLAALFAKPGRTNDFRRLRSKLTVVATNLDTGEAAPFGQPGFDHVPISRAVQASAALPGLFPPVEIDEQFYVDGALKKTLHASVAMEQGARLMLCINPLVPFDATPPSPAPDPGERRLRPRHPGARIPRMVDGGLPAVLSQTFRSLIHSRMALGMKHYEQAFPATDIVLIEPDHRDFQLHRTNLFSYRQRRELAELAYQRTRAFLRSAPLPLTRKLARHGIGLDMSVLRQADRCLAKARAPACGAAALG